MNVLSHPFDRLDPARVVASVESLGFYLLGEPFALNSYENRVYLVSDDEQRRWVAKFYRPARWTNGAIQEEHDFLQELKAAGVAVAAPWRNEQGQSLHQHESYRFALFPNLPGQAPELENPAHLFALGDVIGAAHCVGKQGVFAHRQRLALGDMACDASEAVLSSGWLSVRQEAAYRRVTDKLCAQLSRVDMEGVQIIRVHGDCHVGNMLGRDDHFALVDFDDCLMAPAVQDLWMLLTAQHEADWQLQFSEVIEGYEQHIDFDRRELQLIEPLRTLRLIRYSAWLLARRDDPAFPLAFPWLNDESYWSAHIRELEQQRQAMEQKTRWLA
ncbi:serine/threonine protein kinase [Halomonas halocynthiae]|uniref:serine/threonine protein kinase n=1 Tax=Halomonas halocynthiae TaxID=176290 RepID=UPI00040B5AA3|nr:serine/threonine protein kinase [Halomonas halocynthiae]